MAEGEPGEAGKDGGKGGARPGGGRPRGRERAASDRADRPKGSMGRIVETQPAESGGGLMKTLLGVPVFLMLFGRTKGKK